MTHFDLLAKLVADCASRDVTCYEHEYDSQVFGSWSVTFGGPHHRTRFSWDGKESYLGVSESDFENSNSVPNWVPNPEVCIGGTDLAGKDVFEHIYKMVAARYGT